MSDDSNDSENQVEASAEKTSMDVNPMTAHATIRVDYDSWIETLKNDAEDALQTWAGGGDIGPPKSRDVVSFFIIAGTHIEELSAQALHQNGHQQGLQSVVNQERSNPPNIGKSIDDFRDVRQYERELALEAAGIVDKTGRQYLENTRWVRNKLAHNRDASIKSKVIEDKFKKNNRPFNPSKLPQQTIKAIYQLKSSI